MTSGRRPSRGRREQLRQQQRRQLEVPEMVDAELQLETVGGRVGRREHHARVVDQDVEPRGTARRSPGLPRARLPAAPSPAVPHGSSASAPQGSAPLGARPGNSPDPAPSQRLPRRPKPVWPPSAIRGRWTRRSPRRSCRSGRHRRSRRRRWWQTQTWLLLQSSRPTGRPAPGPDCADWSATSRWCRHASYERPRQRTDDDVRDDLRVVTSVDLATGEPILDEFDERVVERRATLSAVVGRRHHLADHLAIGLPRIDQGRCDVVEYADQPLRDRLGLLLAKTTSCRLTSRLSARARTMSCRVGKWLKKVRLAMSARSQISSIWWLKHLD